MVKYLLSVYCVYLSFYFIENYNVNMYFKNSSGRIYLKIMQISWCCKLLLSLYLVEFSIMIYYIFKKIFEF